jgi:hypothetical protein
LAGQAPPPAALNYTNIDLAGQQQTIVGGVNDVGDVVGGFRDTSGVRHAYIMSAQSEFQSIDFPGATATFGEGINNRGDIVGFYADTSGLRHGFLLSAGQFTTIDFPAANAIFNIAADINDRGEIAGMYNTSDGGIHGYILTRDGFISLDLSSSVIPITQVFGINNRSQVEGDFADASFNTHGFVFRSGAVEQIIDVPGESETASFGMNNANEMVGSAIDFSSGTGFVQHGFLRTKGNFFLVDFPGADGSAPSKINERGTIVGRYFVGGQTHSFLAEPAGPGNSAVQTESPGAVMPLPVRICGSQDWRDHPEDIKDPGSCVMPQ